MTTPSGNKPKLSTAQMLQHIADHVEKARQADTAGDQPSLDLHVQKIRQATEAMSGQIHDLDTSNS